MDSGAVGMDNTLTQILTALYAAHARIAAQDQEIAVLRAEIARREVGDAAATQTNAQ